MIVFYTFIQSDAFSTTNRHLITTTTTTTTTKRRRNSCLNRRRKLVHHSGSSNRIDIIRLCNNDTNNDDTNDNNTNEQYSTEERIQTQNLSSRRNALQTILAATTATSIATISSFPSIANAGKAEIDSKSGQLYSPKNEMIGGGGSDLARGIKLESRDRTSSSSSSSKNGGDGTIQTIYETRFITYLSRFLLNFDPASKSWWNEQEFEKMGGGKMSIESLQKLRFAEFAESVEVGLADYFVGPYGSYASVKAGEFFYIQ